MRKNVAICAVLTMVLAAAAQALPVNVLTFKFDNVASLGENYTPGGVVHDYSTSGNIGHLSATPGVPTWTASGKYGGAFDFTGNGLDSGQSILVHHSASLNPGSGDFAISLWLRTRSEYDGDVLRKGSIASGAETWYKIEHSPSPTNNKLSLNFNTDGTDATVNSTLAYADNQWHFVVAQRRGGAAELWIDGVLNGTASVSGSIANLANLSFGSKDTQDDDFLNSTLDDVRIFMGSLSQEEIQKLYQAVPEPVTIVTLGLGGLAVLRRRRMA